LHYRELYNFYFYNNQELKNTQWPDNIPGLTKPKFTQKLKRLRSLQEPKQDTQNTFQEQQNHISIVEDSFFASKRTRRHKIFEESSSIGR
jgi:hypothetical protein